MTNKKQVEANKNNAKKSTGPKTPSGKLRSSQNALKHGIFTSVVVIDTGDGREPEEEFQRLYENLMDDLKPRGMIEQLIVEKIVISYWRLRRLLKYESGEILELTRNFKKKAIDNYLNPPTAFLEPEKPAPKNLTHYSYDSEISEEEFNVQIYLVCNLGSKEYDLIDIPQVVEQVAYELQEEIDDPTEEELLQAKEHINKMTPGERKTLRDRLYMDAIMKLYEMEEVQKMQVKFDQISRTSCIPHESALDKIQKYDAMLERSIFQNLAALKVLQKERKKSPSGNPENDN